MIRQEGPGEQGQVRGFRNGLEPVKEYLPVTPVAEDRAAFQAADNHMVQGLGGVQAGAAGHAGTIFRPGGRCQVI